MLWNRETTQFHIYITISVQKNCETLSSFTIQVPAAESCLPSGVPVPLVGKLWSVKDIEITEILLAIESVIP